MTAPQPTELTPEALAVIARARKSFLLTMGLLVVGIVIVGLVLVVRAGALGGGGHYTLGAIKIPAGAEVVSVVAADGKVSATYRLGARVSLRIYDGKSGEIIREMAVIDQ